MAKCILSMSYLLLLQESLAILVLVHDKLVAWTHSYFRYTYDGFYETSWLFLMCLEILKCRMMVCLFYTYLILMRYILGTYDILHTLWYQLFPPISYALATLKDFLVCPWSTHFHWVDASATWVGTFTFLIVIFWHAASLHIQVFML